MKTPGRSLKKRAKKLSTAEQHGSRPRGVSRMTNEPKPATDVTAIAFAELAAKMPAIDRQQAHLVLARAGISEAHATMLAKTLPVPDLADPESVLDLARAAQHTAA